MDFWCLSVFICTVITLLSHFGVADVASGKYRLEDTYEGLDFFSKFDFFTGDDPTHGFVDYVNEAEARKLGLIWETDKLVYIGVDHSNIIGAYCRRGRPSIRLESKTKFTRGLIIGSFWHMPGGECGTWPAFWSYGPDWPNSGEIDIIEGVHKQPKNAMALHTSANCIVDGEQSGTWVHHDCSPATPYNAGCGVQSNTDNSFGTGFNSIRGGIYATLWDCSGVQIWFFPRDKIPKDIKRNDPKPEDWGKPQANFRGSGCNFDTHFKQHRITLNVAFCGDWAGDPGVWKDSGCWSEQWPACNCYVAMNPAKFINTYWLVEWIKVYHVPKGYSDASSAEKFQFKAQPGH